MKCPYCGSDIDETKASYCISEDCIKAYEDFEDWEDERDEEDEEERAQEELYEMASNCMCGAWIIDKNGYVKHVSDCICGGGW